MPKAFAMGVARHQHLQIMLKMLLRSQRSGKRDAARLDDDQLAFLFEE